MRDKVEHPSTDAEAIEFAIRTFDGIQRIAGNEMLVRGVYLEFDEEADDLRGSLCGGHRACYIGSLGLSNPEVELFRDSVGRGSGLPGLLLVKADDYIGERPSLKLAYETGERIALAIVNELPEGLDKDMLEQALEECRSKAEGLFECSSPIWDDDEIRDVVIGLCERAKDELRGRLRELSV
jgi:hypothetical protein